MLNYRSAFGVVVAVAAVGVSLSPSIGFTQSFVMKRPDQISEIKIYGPTSRDANPPDWPATFVYRSANGKACTATAIGEQVILTAAHCITAEAGGTIEIKQRKLDVSCQRHPDYPTNISADFSLCLIKPPLPVTAAGFEVVNTDASATPAGAKIKLLGFGCRTQGGPDQSFGQLSEGDATVLPGGDHYIVAGIGAGICFGDSGGGAYVSPGDYRKRRRLVAVNSLTDATTYSRLSVTATPLFTTWARKWSTDHKVAICGLDPAAHGCHQ